LNEEKKTQRGHQVVTVFQLRSAPIEEQANGR